MRLKILIPIVVLAVIALIFLSYYFQSSIDTGLFLSIIPIASPFLFYALDYYQKPKVNLKISKAQFTEVKINDNLRGHQLKAKVTNKGKKICLSPNAHFAIGTKEGKKVTLMLANTQNNNGKISTSTHEEPFSQIKYAWLDEANKKSDVKELRQNDSYHIIFPSDPLDVSTGASFGGGHSFGFSSHTEHLLKLEGSVYAVEIELKGEDADKNTVIKKQKFNLTVDKSTTEIETKQ